MGFSRGPPKRWSLNDTYGFIATFFEPRYARPYALRTTARRGATHPPSRSLSVARDTNTTPSHAESQNTQTQPPKHHVQRGFHTYFVTHLPSSSLHPDSRIATGPHHKLPRSAAAPHNSISGAAPVSPPHLPANRDLTVVRIPLRSAKHHFGAADSRGSRPYNEDTNQAGTIDIPAFARRAPISLVRNAMKKTGEGTSADSAYGDPQIFYFGVFDGHGGNQCSNFLRDELHGYIEETAQEFELSSSLRSAQKSQEADSGSTGPATQILSDSEAGGRKKLDELDMKGSEAVAAKAEIPEISKRGAVQEIKNADAAEGAEPVPAEAKQCKALRLQKELVQEYRSTIGGYFRRFNPPHFRLEQDPDSSKSLVSIESVLTYAFLRADLDFITAQARKPDPDDPYVSDAALNTDEILGKPHHLPPSGQGIGGRTRFKGGSTASVALISTPTPAPFWHPAASSTLLVGHVGDTRMLLCETATGLSHPLTSDHHPSSPSESHRLRRFTASFITDSFGEERIQGLANSRAFGDMASKRLGVSAEPEITRTELGPAQYSFLVLMSDGVSGTLSDQEIVDVVKEAKTPEQGARDVVSYATEVSSDGDNATCLVVRLGGWERRSEGGLGSLGTKEIRDFRRNEALDPRRGIR
ncbi:protein serine/threonine phosphatase 2C [Hypoxylon rubiginosum]|uniref:Protein serine/threonine phosphatase 2C n=1 Tax=Hypoxylon rubiginosum TaxID=110542 RepID=A0ACC0CV05_9PEZI|nr:protein serine/threonine phosphatase 2C [Hypoxylon rubiginosum]